MNCRALGHGLALCLAMLGREAVADCWAVAAGRHGLEPELLRAIAVVESGLRPDAHHVNGDGSQDIGIMQINSVHLPRLARAGITRERLFEEPCLAIDVGAQILAGFVARYGYSWAAVGAYNAGTSGARDAQRMRYARKVWREYRRLLAVPASDEETDRILMQGTGVRSGSAPGLTLR